jgi:ribulose-phosphate 3-epimerase
MGPIVVEAARRVTALPIDVHLMIENPERYISEFAKAGATLISVQVEACRHLNRTVQLIKEAGARPGVVLNPSTPISSIEWVLESIDFVLIMSVNPGFGGQSFIPNSLEKIRNLKDMIQDKKSSVLIEIDGGVKENNIAEISLAGADAFVAGSAIFGSGDYARTIANFREKMG